jgi:hypothetical protein
MTDQLSWSAVGELLAGFAPEGPLRTAVLLVYGLCVAVAPFIYRYYLGVLAQGAAPEGSLERQDYDKLRASLAGGNLAARLYAKWLTAFLDGVERFFGDKGMADRTLFPRAFGLRTPAPLWTAPAFDRCLLLALIYPIATIFLIWAVSEHVGPAERALGLNPVPGWLRGLVAASIGFSSFALWRSVPARGWKSVVWFFGAIFVPFPFLFFIAGAVDARFSRAHAIAVSGALFSALFFAIFGAGVVDSVEAFAFPGALCITFTVAFCFFVTIAAVIGPATACLIAIAFLYAASVLNVLAIKHRLQGVFLSLFLPAMVLACLAAADLLSHLDLATWKFVGPLLLFLGLLTLLNAPFDWASLGLTRALLRRGLELGGWWPYLLAFVDAALAGVIIALLALVMVLGVQAFDELAVHGGGKPVLPLDALFDGIANNPAAPEYWWAYALLLSSMIPSLINLMISGMAFTRGIPWLARLLLQWIPEGKAVPEYKRQPAAIGLTVQMFGAQVSASRRRRFSPGASFSMSCPGLASICSKWPASSRASTCRCGLRSLSRARFSPAGVKPEPAQLFMHVARNSLRALPCNFCSSALVEHSLDLAFLAISSADMAGAFGTAGALGAAGAAGAAGALICA